MNEPKELAENGWVFYEKCTGCKRINKWKYRNDDFPGLELYWYISFGKFSIKEKGKTLIRQADLKNLKNTLKQL